MSSDKTGKLLAYEQATLELKAFLSQLSNEFRDQAWQYGPMDFDLSSRQPSLFDLFNWLLYSFFITFALSLVDWLFGCLVILFSVKYELRLKN